MLFLAFEIVQAYYILSFACLRNGTSSTFEYIILALCYLFAGFSTFAYKCLALCSAIIVITSRTCPQFPSQQLITPFNLAILIIICYVALLFWFCYLIGMRLAQGTFKCSRCKIALDVEGGYYMRCCMAYYHVRCMVDGKFCPTCGWNCSGCGRFMDKEQWNKQFECGSRYHK